MRALSPWILALGGTFALLGGCASLVQTRKDTPPVATTQPRDASREALDKAGHVLEGAKRQLRRELWTLAIDDARDVRKRLRQIEGYSSADDRARHQRLFAESIVVEGLAFRAQNDDLGAVFALRGELDAERCGPDLIERCREHHAWLFDGKYRALFTRFDYTHGRHFTTKEVSSFYPTPLGTLAISTETLAALPNYFSTEDDYLALWLTASDGNQLTRDGVHFALSGRSWDDVYEVCERKIGTLALEKEKAAGPALDVVQCEEMHHRYDAASLQFQLSTHASETFHLEGQRVLLVFRRQNLRKLSPHAWALGEAEVVRVVAEEG